MPTHKIEVAQPPKTVLNNDVRFSIYSDGELLGELMVSKGSIDWRPPRAQYIRRMRWERFARIMENPPK